MRATFLSLLLIVALPTVLGTGTVAAAAPSAEKNAAQMATTTIAIEGMACGFCAAKVTAALKGLDGVKDARVSHTKNEAVVQYDPAKLTPEKLVRVIGEAGFKATLPSQKVLAPNPTPPGRA